MKKSLFVLALCLIGALGVKANITSADLPTGPSLWTVTGNVLKPVNPAWTVTVNTNASSSTFTNATTTNLVVTGSSALGTVTSGTWNGSVIGQTNGGSGTSTPFANGTTLIQGANGYTSENILYPDSLSGSDLLAQIGTAYTNSPAAGGQANIAPGLGQNVATPLKITNNGQPLAITFSPGTALTWNGSTTGTAITLDADVTNKWQSSSLNGGRLLGPGSVTTTNASTTGVTIGGANNSPGTSISNEEIGNFGTCVNVSSNTWVTLLFHDFVYGCGTEYLFSGTSNSGENLASIHSDYFNQTSTSTPCFNLSHNVASFTSLADSYDGCGVYNGPGDLSYTVIGGHHENTDAPYNSYPYFVNATSTFSSMNITGGTYMNDGTGAGTSPPYFGYNNANLTVSGIDIDNNNTYQVPSFLSQGTTGNFVYQGISAIGNTNPIVNLVNGVGGSQSWYPWGAYKGSTPLAILNSSGQFSIGAQPPGNAAIKSFVDNPNGTASDVQMQVENDNSGNGAYIATNAQSDYSDFENVGTSADWKTGLTNNTTSWTLLDNTDSKTPITVVQNAPSNSIYVASTGNVGLGTSTPSGALVVEPTHANGIGGYEFLVGDSVASTSNPFIYSYKASAGVGSIGTFGFNAYLNSGGTQVQYNTKNNGYYWSLDDRSSTDNPLLLNEISSAGTFTSGELAVTPSGFLGIGTTTVPANLTITGTSTKASIRVGTPVTNNVGCLEIYDSVNTTTLEYIYSVSGTLTESSTKPAFCQ